MVVAPTIYLTSARAANSPLLAKLSERLQSSGSTVVNANAVRKDAVEDDRPAYLRRQAWMDDSQLVVADAGSGDASVGAEVYYALHKARVPALCLVPRGEPVPGMLAAGAHPLLTTVEYADDAAAEEAVEAFVRPSAEPGRVFVIEGGDGAGKQTQTRMLMERLRATGHPVRTMDFPHDSAMHGKLIRELLTGAKGDIKAVNPLLFASLYAQNRWDVAPILHEWVRRGYNVVLDRYVEANFGHQASKLPADERPPLVAALSEFEHGWLGLPRAHRVVYLDLPPAEAKKAMEADGTRAALDMHEKAGDAYKNSVRDTFVWCAGHFGHWARLPCVDADGRRATKQELSDTLHATLASEFVNGGSEWE
jgi:dTMP kinase